MLAIYNIFQIIRIRAMAELTLGFVKYVSRAVWFWKLYWNSGFDMVKFEGTPPVPGLVTVIVDCIVMSGRQEPVDASDQSQYGNLTC